MSTKQLKEMSDVEDESQASDGGSHDKNSGSSMQVSFSAAAAALTIPRRSYPFGPNENGAEYPYTQIDLTAGGLQRIPEGVLKKANNVKTLILSINPGVQLNGIRSFVNITSLSLAHTGLRNLPEEVTFLVKVEYLDISGNKDLRELPNTLANLQELRMLYAQECDLKDLPSEIGKLKNLLVVRINVNKNLRRLPESFCQLDKLEELFACECDISGLPDGFRMLKNLKELHISGNKNLQEFPLFFCALSNLEVLIAKECNFGLIPSHIGKLHNLQELHLDGNPRLTSVPKSLTSLSKLKVLNLVGCKITQMPEDFGELRELRKLHISHNKGMKELPERLTELAKLEILHVSDCDISKLNDGIGKLHQLQELHVNDNTRLDRLPSSITLLNYLTILIVSNCNISKLPNDIGKLNKLQHLDIAENRNLKELPESLEYLTELEKFDAKKCDLLSLPASIGKLKRLKTLDISYNRSLRVLPTSFKELSELEILFAQECDLRSLTDGFGELQNLQELYLNGNRQLSSLPLSLSGLGKLKILKLFDCNLNSLHDEFRSLEKLEILDLSDNNLEEFPGFALCLKNLTELYLSNRKPQMPFTVQGNRIKTLPAHLLNLTTLKKLDLDDRTIAEPPQEIVRLGFDAIKSYLQDSQGGELMCADTITIIGDPKAGKTSIAQSLHCGHPKAAESDDQTRVMERLKANFDGSVVHVNDLGKHDAYRAVIPMFLPTNGLVVLAFNMCENPEHLKKTMRKWMMTIIAKCSRIRVVLAGTRADQIHVDSRKELEKSMDKFVNEILGSAKNEVENHMKELNRLQANRLAKLYALQSTLKSLEEADITVVTLNFVSADAEKDLAKLRNLISRKLEPASKIPASWCKFIKAVTESKKMDHEPCPYLTWDDIKDLATKLLPKRYRGKTLTVLLRYLNTSSQIIWLEHHKDLRLKIFYHPQRVAAICKNVLSHHGSEAMHERVKDSPVYKSDMEGYKIGKLSKQLLSSFLGEVRDGMVDTVITLMKHFNLIGEVEDVTTGTWFIVPSRLPDDPPPEIGPPIANAPVRPTVCIRLKFIGSLIPMAFFESNFASIVTYVHLVQAHPYLWKHGVSFRHNQISVIIRRIESDGILELIAFSENEKKNIWELLNPMLARVRTNVDAWWKGASPECVIVCPACKYVLQDSSQSPGLRSTTLSELFFSRGSHAAYWNCPQCKSDIPSSLIFPRPPVGAASKRDSEEIAKFIRNMTKRSATNGNANEGIRSSFGDTVVPEISNEFEGQGCQSPTPEDGTGNRDRKHVGQSDRRQGLSGRQTSLGEAPNPRAELAWMAPKQIAENPSSSGSSASIQSMLRSVRVLLIAELALCDISHITDLLYQGECINERQREQIQNECKKSPRSDAARCFVDTVKFQGGQAITILIDGLASEQVGRSLLAQQVRAALEEPAPGTDFHQHGNLQMSVPPVNEGNSGKSNATIRRIFKRFRVQILNQLEKPDILYITNLLYQENCINERQKEQIENERKKNTRSDAAQCLVDIVEFRGAQAITTFIEGLESEEVGRSSLARQVQAALEEP